MRTRDRRTGPQGALSLLDRASVLADAATTAEVRKGNERRHRAGAGTTGSSAAAPRTPSPAGRAPTTCLEGRADDVLFCGEGAGDLFGDAADEVGPGSDTVTLCRRDGAPRRCGCRCGQGHD